MGAIVVPFVVRCLSAQSINPQDDVRRFQSLNLIILSATRSIFRMIAAFRSQQGSAACHGLHLVPAPQLVKGVVCAEVQAFTSAVHQLGSHICEGLREGGIEVSRCSNCVHRFSGCRHARQRAMVHIGHATIPQDFLHKNKQHERCIAELRIQTTEGGTVRCSAMNQCFRHSL